MPRPHDDHAFITIGQSIPSSQPQVQSQGNLDDLLLQIIRHANRYPDVMEYVMICPWSAVEARQYPNWNSKMQDYLTLFRMIALHSDFLPRLRAEEQEVRAGIKRQPTGLQIVGTTVFQRMLIMGLFMDNEGDNLFHVFLRARPTFEEMRLPGNVISADSITEETRRSIREVTPDPSLDPDHIVHRIARGNF